MSDLTICDTCDGTGVIHVICRYCGGSGWRSGYPGGEICCGGYDTEECEDCGGTGEVPEE